MIGFAPPLEDDESFEGYQSRVAGLFDRRAKFAHCYQANRAGLPSRINSTLNNLSDSPSFDADDIVDDNSLFPLTAAFLDPQEAQSLRDFMLHGNRFPGRLYLGVHRRRFCAQCVSDDESRLGFAYWRNIHLSPLVFVCPIHEEQLIEWTGREDGPPSVLSSRTIPAISDWLLQTALLCRVSQLAKWILENKPAPIPGGIKTLGQRMKILLAGAGFSVPDALPRKVERCGGVKTRGLKRLSRCLLNCYGADELLLLGVVTADNQRLVEGPASILALTAYLNIEPGDLFGASCRLASTRIAPSTAA